MLRLCPLRQCSHASHLLGRYRQGSSAERPRGVFQAVRQKRPSSGKEYLQCKRVTASPYSHLLMGNSRTLSSSVICRPRQLPIGPGDYLKGHQFLVGHLSLAVPPPPSPGVTHRSHSLQRLCPRSYIPGCHPDRCQSTRRSQGGLSGITIRPVRTRRLSDWTLDHCASVLIGGEGQNSR